eukprot:TRINITY_DN7492_c0_g1_i1.p2 TRINITY_DN7492_c0_g1~~TRINITY_DN7492_c0_g1_i1.p2  ORF type:complete len:217 (+),score=38.44 TRINITY_DN7492_c0_g1_i1:175-825(+)
MTTLILVPCHAIYTGGAVLEADESWILQSFQQGEAKYFVQHIQTAIDLLNTNKASRLVFSGGYTRQGATTSEAASYLAVARQLSSDIPSSRIFLEEDARDSLENLAYGLALFKSKMNGWPSTVKVVGWSFKSDRFRAHFTAVQNIFRLPSDIQPEYVGVCNPDDLAGAMRGEAKALALFQANPLGNDGELLEKKRARNPYQRSRHASVEEIQQIVW